LIVAALLLYLSFQSISLDDFDSVSFALALNHFDISLQQPHPPGFPVYVAMGKIAHTLIPDARAVLTLVSAMAGTVGVVALAWLGTELGNLSTGLLAALWLMTLPGYWLLSEMALSDVPGVALIVLAVGCLWKGRSNWRWLAAGAAISGLCLGLRPQNAIPVIIFGLYAIILQRRRVTLPQVGIIAAVGIIALFLWLIPTVAVSGGWSHYGSSVQAHSNHIIQSDSLFRTRIDSSTISTRVASFGNGLLELIGDNPWVALVTAAILIVGLLCVPWRSAAARLCTLWLVAVALQVFLLESLERPRLYLPFVPPLLLLVALGWSGSLQRRLNRYMLAIPLLMIGVFASTALPLAQTLSRELTPPTQATHDIAAHYTPDKTVVVAQGSYRHVQWELPQYQSVYLNTPDVQTAARPVVSAHPTYLVLLDRDDIWPEAYSALTEAGSYVPIEDHVFNRDPRVFPQHSLVRMQVLTPLKLLNADQLALPPSGTIQVGGEANGRYFGEGWYRSENIGGVAARWTQQTAVIRVALRPVNTTLTLEAAPYPTDQSVEVIVNDRSIGTLPLRGIWQSTSLTIPGDAIAGQAISTIRFKHTRTDIPPGSNRVLAAAYRTITLVPSP
jgi:hypothetical protein